MIPSSYNHPKPPGAGCFGAWFLFCGALSIATVIFVVYVVLRVLNGAGW